MQNDNFNSERIKNELSSVCGLTSTQCGENYMIFSTDLYYFSFLLLKKREYFLHIQHELIASKHQNTLKEKDNQKLHDENFSILLYKLPNSVQSNQNQWVLNVQKRKEKLKMKKIV